MASIYQINLHKCEVATAITPGKHKDAIYLIQEIYYTTSGKPGVRTKSHFHGKNKSRAAIYLSALSSCTFVPMHDFTDTDIATGIIEGGSLREPTIISSVYLDIRKDTILPKFRELVEYCHINQKPLICGIDCNAHSLMWGCGETNVRGEELEEFILEEGLYVENVGTTPTWRRANQSSIIDITLSLNTRGRIGEWQVLPEHTLSDHRMINFRVDNLKHGKVLKRNYSKADWPVFRSIIESDLPEPPSEWNNDLIESSSLMMTEIITQALDIACPKHMVRQRDKLFWWNQECNNAKTKYIALERKMLKSLKSVSATVSTPSGNQINIENQRLQVKKARRAFKSAVRRAKRHSFRKLVFETADMPAMSKLNKILDEKRGQSLGLVRKPNGDMATSTSESLKIMIKEHFPGSNSVEELGKSINEDPLRPLESCTWITNIRIKEALKQFKADKSAGPDKLKPIVLHNLPDCVISYLRILFNACIQTGYTPTKWCHSIVSFMAKPDKGSYVEPRSFRPLSLTSFIFKCLEKLIVWRVEETALRINPLHPRQFAFRKNFSTDNALTESINTIEKSYLRGGMVIVIYLDI